jgi:hypothetical protein
VDKKKVEWWEDSNRGREKIGLKIGCHGSHIMTARKGREKKKDKKESKREQKYPIQKKKKQPKKPE